jgi:hypothetical protein
MNFLSLLARLKRRPRYRARKRYAASIRPAWHVHDQRPGPCVWLAVYDDNFILRFSTTYWLN